MTTFERFEGDLPMLLDELAPPREPRLPRLRLRADRALTPAARLELPRKVASYVHAHRADGSPAARPGASDGHPGPPERRTGPSPRCTSAGRQLRQMPAPFGVAGNGKIAYVLDNDIYTFDPATGIRQAVVAGTEAVTMPAYFSMGSTSPSCATRRRASSTGMTSWSPRLTAATRR